MAQRIVAGRYQLQREVGRGGMATVYLCTDVKHGREVALKVLRPELAELVGAERFLREIAITAALNHPHILPQLDSGAEDGLLYYVMPYLSGGSLRLLLAGGAIPLEAVTRITGEIASALDYAHTRGIVHRDIKPENVLFSEGVVVVADFGIARALSGVTASRLTVTGVSVGTLGYMSPEQALGTAELDARSDVYSLGCVVYELLVGSTPASWPDAGDVALGRFSDLPAHHRAKLDACPGRVEQVMVQALALRAQHRFATPGEFAARLSTAAQRTAPFSEDQVRKLLRRAAELQAASPDPPAGGELTIGAVEQIAAQVGIPPEHVRAAARQLQHPVSPAVRPQTPVPSVEPSMGQPALAGGAPLPARSGAPVPAQGGGQEAKWDRLVATATALGELSEEVFPAMVAEIERRLGIVGHVSVMGRTLTWSPATQGEETRKLVVQVNGRDGLTSVRIQESLELQGLRKLAIPAGIMTLAAFGAAWTSILGLPEPAVGLFTVLSGALGGFLGVRMVVATDSMNRQPQLQKLAEALAELARNAQAPAASSENPAAISAGTVIPPAVENG